MNATQQLEMQLSEWLTQKARARAIGLEAALAATADMHIVMLKSLRGIDPDDLATVTLGRVTCPVEHRALLRELIARPMPLEPGMVVPWRLTGDLATAIRSAQRTLTQLQSLPDDGLPLAPSLLLVFLAHAACHLQTSGWRWHIVHTAELEALEGASAGDLTRLALESPRLGLVFAPPDAREQEAARLMTTTERGLRRFADAKVATHALLTRVMR